MLKRFSLGLFRVLLAMLLPAAAAAQMATTAKNVHLRAGPAREYPVVAVLPAGLEISVLGCLSSYTWCDVIAGAERGWVWAGNINYAYQGAYVPVLRYGMEIGIMVTPFIFFDYWSGHYRDRPWYRDRDRWAHPPRRPPPALRPPPGEAHPPAPPRRPNPPPPLGAQPPAPTHRPPPGQTDRPHLPQPPHGVSREAPSPLARGTPSGDRR